MSKCRQFCLQAYPENTFNNFIFSNKISDLITNAQMELKKQDGFVADLKAAFFDYQRAQVDSHKVSRPITQRVIHVAKQLACFIAEG